LLGENNNASDIKLEPFTFKADDGTEVKAFLNGNTQILLPLMERKIKFDTVS
jgi:hypothetical protein